MTEPRRLLNGGDEAMATLLRSAQDDAPSPEARERALAALGLAGGTAAVLTSIAAAKAEQGALAKLGVSLGAAKWPLVAGLCIAFTGGLGLWVTAGQVDEPAHHGLALAPTWAAAPHTRPAVPHTSPVAPAAPAAAPAEAELDPRAHEGAEPAAAPVVAAAPATTAHARGPIPARPSLAEEVAALDRARKALADDPEGALDALDDYRERFHDGALAEEAEVLQIESLARAGKADATRARAAAFLAAHPESPLAPRVRAVVAQLPSE
ncbi:MAG: hypothetical protein R3B72_50945 [Polyangiaceae bacterium]